MQIRHKGFWSRETFAPAETIGLLCRSAGALFVVNDRADYAALLGAGIHVGQEDLSPSDARSVVGPGAVLGYSTHSAEQVVLAEGFEHRSLARGRYPVAAQKEGEIVGCGGVGIDYLAFGPVFFTVSKERPDPSVGIAGLTAIRALTRKPLVAIGGITRDNALSCLAAGADSVAVIADLYPNPCTKITLRDRMTEWRNLTDS